MAESVNLRVIKRSRRRPERGDVFVMQLADGHFLFGRVILAEPPREQAPMPGSYLIYVYRDRRADKVVDWQGLRPDRLLLAPMWINRMAWTKGYFETVASRPLESQDLLEQHCFRDWTGDYLNESGQKLGAPVEPCGDWALSSYRLLDDQISDALGFERAPD